MSRAAVEFLQQHGARSLISFGCGHILNRMDNHVRLLVGCNLDYYVAVDRVTRIEIDPQSAFTDPDTITPLLKSHYNGVPNRFFKRIQTFPDTYVEELAGIHCQIIVCQRVLPFRHWEDIIGSMRPLLVLQEDLRGCELQILDKKVFKKSVSSRNHFQLQPFKPYRWIPCEKNFVIWRKRDFTPCYNETIPLWKRLISYFSKYPLPPPQKMHPEKTEPSYISQKKTVPPKHLYQ